MLVFTKSTLAEHARIQPAMISGGDSWDVSRISFRVMGMGLLGLGERVRTAIISA